MRAIVSAAGRESAYAGAMYKDFHNKFQSLPQGHPQNPWVNLMWLLVFSPHIVMLAMLAVVGIWAIGDVLYHLFFG